MNQTVVYYYDKWAIVTLMSPKKIFSSHLYIFEIADHESDVYFALFHYYCLNNQKTKAQMHLLAIQSRY